MQISLVEAGSVMWTGDLADFLAENDMMDQAERARVSVAVHEGRSVNVGGGASPLVTIRPEADVTAEEVRACVRYMLAATASEPGVDDLRPVVCDFFDAGDARFGCTGDIRVASRAVGGAVQAVRWITDADLVRLGNHLRSEGLGCVNVD